MANAPPDQAPHQFRLLRERRFSPFFWTMFLGAFNDNLYKNALVILVAFQGASVMGLDPSAVVNLAGAVFIAPYILLSATAGQLADRCEKSMLIRRLKLLEVAIMVVGAAGFLFHEIGLLLVVLFALGAQASLFGPVKYSYLPQHVSLAELTGANGLVETGMYVAILTGTLAGGILVARQGWGPQLAAGAALACALAGYLASRSIPVSPAADPGLRVNWNLLSETAHNARMIRAQPQLWWSVLGNSWFWFFGALFLAQVPGFTRDVLHGDESVTTLILACFSVGIGIGSLLCERLSRGRVELGLVPLGAAGMSGFALLLGLIPIGRGQHGAVLDAWDCLGQVSTLWPMLDFILVGCFGGFFIVPLYATLQSRGDARAVARVIAANNVVNALFIVASALFAIVALGFGAGIRGLFVLAAGLNAAFLALMLLRMPELRARWRRGGWLDA